MMLVSNIKKFSAFFVFFILLFSYPFSSNAAIFGFSPSTTKIVPLDTFSVQVFVNTSGEAINAVSGLVTYSDMMIEPTSIVVSDTVTSWINESPKVSKGSISFEGITFDPGFSGGRKLLFTVFFKAKKTGISEIRLTEGSILKNDGFGTNVLDGLSTLQIKILERFSNSTISGNTYTPQSLDDVSNKISALPVIIDYSSVVYPGGKLFVKGLGEPNALTLIEFQLVSKKTFGDKLLDMLGQRRHTISDVYIINNSDGSFEYTSNSEAIPGVYTAIPFFVGQGTSTKEPGLGAQLNVLSDSGEYTFVSLVNMLTLIIPLILIALISAVIYRRRSNIK